MAYNSVYTGTQIDEAIGRVQDLPENVAGLDSDNKVAAAEASASMVKITENRTLQLSDAGKMLLADSASAIMLTVPFGVFPIGTEIEVCRRGSGSVTLAGATSVDLLSVTGTFALGDRYSVVSLKYIEERSGSEKWLVAGGLA